LAVVAEHDHAKRAIILSDYPVSQSSLYEKEADIPGERDPGEVGPGHVNRIVTEQQQRQHERYGYGRPRYRPESRELLPPRKPNFPARHL
jgi:hypothetical protein